MNRSGRVPFVVATYVDALDISKFFELADPSNVIRLNYQLIETQEPNASEVWEPISTNDLALTNQAASILY